MGRLHAVGAEIIDRFNKVRKAEFQLDPSCPRLVVTTQGIDRDALIVFLETFLLSYPGNCVLNVKLHPAYDKSPVPYNKILGADHRVRILCGTDEPNTFDLIARSDLHLSIASACHFDALGIGTPTVVLGLAGHDVVLDLVAAGDAMFAGSPVELADIVGRRCWTAVTETVSGKYYCHGFLKNLSPLIA